MLWRWLILASLLLGSARAGAQSAQGAASAQAGGDRTEEAKGLFNAGRAAFDAGRYADALDYFERAYTISGRIALLYNIGLAFDRLREDQRALDAYDQYLTHAPDAPNRVEVETRAAAIRAALARRQRSEAAAPSPAQTAAAAPAAAPAVTVAATSEPPPRADREASSGLQSQWWFWTAAAVVVAGGVTAAVLVASSGDDDPDPIQPSSGIVVTTLSRAP